MNAARTLPLQSPAGVAVGTAFDTIAEEYDQIFTNTLIGRAQRDAVWGVLVKSFREGDNILELNCGTGEDAIFLSSNGISVFACDASGQMIARAETRLRNLSVQVPATFCQLSTERLEGLHPETQFDGAFSNFSGLNCVADLNAVSTSLARLVKPGGCIVLCFSTRFCLIEILYFLARGRWRKAVRRLAGSTRARLEDASFTVYYPTFRAIRRAFAPDFRLYARTGVGVAVPPSYLEPWAQKHPRLFAVLRYLEGPLASIPFLRSVGDHALLCFYRSSL
jgi:ubiquinone/menaquinone biosynthesis C-methylase UbiE